MLVVSVEDDMLVVMITGAENKLSLEHDYKIIDWKEAGLVKPSLARVDRLAVIPFDYIGTSGYIGKLTQRDQDNLKKVLLELS